MKRLVLVAALVVAAPSLAFAHKGALDKNGCHTNKSKHVYECHQGAMKGQTFKNKAEAKAAMKNAPQTGSSGMPTDQQAETPNPR